MESVSYPNPSETAVTDDSSPAFREERTSPEDANAHDTETYDTAEYFACVHNSQSPGDADNDDNDPSKQDEYNGGAAPPPTGKLIVNYLPQTMSDDEFRGMFLSCGPVKSSKICRDRETGFSFGFGFVEFFNLADATKAIELLNGHIIGHKRLKVAYSRPPTREMHEANLYMRGLPKTWTEEELKNWCSKYGEIIQVRVLKDPNTGLCRGTGFVLFNRKGEADSCRAEMNGIVLPECTDPLVVKIAEGNEQKVRPPPGMVAPTYSQGYPMQAPAMPGPQMGRYFQEPYGVAAPSVATSAGGPLRTGNATPRMRYNPMVASSVKMHVVQQGKQPTAVASTAEMVGLATPILPVAGNVPRAATRATLPSYTTTRTMPAVPPPPAPFVPVPPPQPTAQMPMLAQFDCPNDPPPTVTPVGVGPSSGMSQSATPGPGYQLFVYNCGTTCDEKELYELFGPYGAISKVDVVRDPMNGNTKFAFVSMVNYEEACAAVQSLNGYCYTPRPLQVKFKSPNLQPPGSAPGRG